MLPTPAILLFDGVCNLCNGLVQFIIRRDPHGQFRFAALQSATGQELLAAYHLPPVATTAPDSVVLLEGGQAYLRSAAVLRVVRRLGWPWRLLALGELVPRRWRDALYRFIAQHRYQWFGRQAACLMPTPELKERFLP